jgi:hypothetical protein
MFGPPLVVVPASVELANVPVSKYVNLRTRDCVLVIELAMVVGFPRDPDIAMCCGRVPVEVAAVSS